MYTANTMASAIEALGLSLPNSSAQDAISDTSSTTAGSAGAAVVELLTRASSRRDILTREAFENAITVVIALGGSTNAVLHLLAMAYEAGVTWTWMISPASVRACRCSRICARAASTRCPN